MFPYRHCSLVRLIAALTAFVFTFSATMGYAQVSPRMPVPGTMVSLSPAFDPALARGIQTDPKDPFHFNFIITPGQDLSPEKKKDEYTKLIKYFLVSLAIPNEEMWVNLSPYEHDRMIPDNFARTEMGRDLLAQDYLLKQLMSSLIYPEKGVGKAFWAKVYAKARETYGTSDIPVDTFNKVWIVPDQATVYEKDNTAVVVGCHLKVMLESDYVAQSRRPEAEQSGAEGSPAQIDNKLNNTGGPSFSSGTQDDVISTTSSTQELSRQIMREVVIPELEQEVNQGEHFAPLRQVYYSMILATWFKQSLKESVLGQVYADRSKTTGVEQPDVKVNEEIYQKYLEAFKKGAFNYIKDDYDVLTQEVIPRKYFSGGLRALDRAQVIRDAALLTPEARASLDAAQSGSDLAMVDLVKPGTPAKGNETSPKRENAVARAKGKYEALDIYQGTMYQENRRTVLKFFEKFSDREVEMDLTELINSSLKAGSFGADLTGIKEMIKDDPVASFHELVRGLIKDGLVSLGIEGEEAVLIKDKEGQVIARALMTDDAKRWMSSLKDQPRSTEDILKALRLALFDRFAQSLEIRINMQLVLALARDGREAEAEKAFFAETEAQEVYDAREEYNDPQTGQAVKAGVADLVRLAELMLSVEAGTDSQRQHPLSPWNYLSLIGTRANTLPKVLPFLRANHQAFLHLGLYAKDYFDAFEEFARRGDTEETYARLEETNLLKPEFLEFCVKLAGKMRGFRGEQGLGIFYYFFQLETGTESRSVLRDDRVIRFLLDHQDDFFALPAEVADAYIRHLQNYQQNFYTIYKTRVARRSLSEDTVEAGLIWDDLIRNGYIDSLGRIQEKFHGPKEDFLNALTEIPDAQKEKIYAILQEADVVNPFASSDVLGQTLALGPDEDVLTTYFQLVYLHRTGPAIFTQLSDWTAEQRAMFVAYLFNDGPKEKFSWNERLSDEEAGIVFSEASLRLFRTYGAAALPLVRALRTFPGDLKNFLETESGLMPVMSDLHALGLAEDIVDAWLVMRDNRGALRDLETLKRLVVIGRIDPGAAKFIISLIKAQSSLTSAILAQSGSLAKLNANIRASYLAPFQSSSVPEGWLDPGTLDVVAVINDPKGVDALLERMNNGGAFSSMMANPQQHAALIDMLNRSSTAVSQAEIVKSFSGKSTEMGSILTLIDTGKIAGDLKDDLLEANEKNPAFTAYLVSDEGQEFFKDLRTRSPALAQAYVLYVGIYGRSTKNYAEMTKNYRNVFLSEPERFGIILMSYLGHNPEMMNRSLDLLPLKKIYKQSSGVLDQYLSYAGSNAAFLENSGLVDQVLAMLDADIQAGITMPVERNSSNLPRKNRAGAWFVESPENRSPYGWEVAMFFIKISGEDPANYKLFLDHEDLFKRIHPALLSNFLFSANISLLSKIPDVRGLLEFLAQATTPHAAEIILSELLSLLAPREGQSVEEAAARMVLAEDWVATLKSAAVRENLDRLGKKQGNRLDEWLRAQRGVVSQGNVVLPVSDLLRTRAIRFLLLAGGAGALEGLDLPSLRNIPPGVSILEAVSSEELLSVWQNLSQEFGKNAGRWMISRVITSQDPGAFKALLTGDYIASLRTNAAVIFGDQYPEVLSKISEGSWGALFDLIGRPAGDFRKSLDSLQALLGSNFFESEIKNKRYSRLQASLRLIKDVQDAGLNEQLISQINATSDELIENESGRIRYFNMLATADPDFVRLLISSDAEAVRAWQGNFRVFETLSQVFTWMNTYCIKAGQETVRKFFIRLINKGQRSVAKDLETFMTGVNRSSNFVSAGQLISFLNSFLESRDARISETVEVMRIVGDLLLIKVAVPGKNEIKQFAEDLDRLAKNINVKPEKSPAANYAEAKALADKIHDKLNTRDQTRVQGILESIRGLDDLEAIKARIDALVTRSLASSRVDNEELKADQGDILKALFRNVTGAAEFPESLRQNPASLEKVITLVKLYYKLSHGKEVSGPERQTMKENIKALLTEFARTGDESSMDRMIMAYKENVEERKRLKADGYDLDILDKGLDIKDFEAPYVVEGKRTKAAQEAIQRHSEPIIDLAKDLKYIPEGMTEAQRDELKLSTYAEASGFLEGMLQGRDRQVAAHLQEVLELIKKTEEEARTAVSRIGGEKVRIVVAKGASDESTIGMMPESACFSINGGNGHMPVAHSMEGNAIIARIYDQQNNMIANVVLALTDKGVVVYKSYGKRADLNLDVAWMEAWKQLAQWAPAVILTNTSAGIAAARDMPVVEKITKDAPFKAVKRATVFKGPLYYDWGKPTPSGSVEYELTEGFTFRAKDFPGTVIAAMDRKPVAGVAAVTVAAPVTAVPVRTTAPERIMNKLEMQGVRKELNDASDGKLDLIPLLRDLSGLIFGEGEPEDIVSRLGSRNGPMPEQDIRRLRGQLAQTITHLRSIFRDQELRRKLNIEIDDRLRRTIELIVVKPQNDRKQKQKLAEAMAELPAREYGISAAGEVDLIVVSMMLPHGVNIVLRNGKEEVIGYVLARSFQDMVPRDREEQDLDDQDLEGADAKTALYVDDININLDYRTKPGVVRKLLNALREEATKKGFRILMMHARKNNGLSAFLQVRRIGAKVVRSYDHWEAYQGDLSPQGEPADLLKLDLEAISSLNGQVDNGNIGKVDSAMKGGIDLNVNDLNLIIKRDGAGVPLPAILQDPSLLSIPGLVPVILEIAPGAAANLPIFSGLSRDAPFDGEGKENHLAEALSSS